MKWATLSLATLGITTASSALAAQTYDWTFSVQAVSDGFSGPPTYIDQVLGSGTFSTSDTGVATTYDDGFGDVMAAKRFTITDFMGTIAGTTITGLGTSSTWTSDNALEFVEGQGWVLAPTGVVVLNTAKAVDGARQVYLSADNFSFGGFVDTAHGNEWQGVFSITPVPAPLPAPGASALGLLTLLMGLARRYAGSGRAAAT